MVHQDTMNSCYLQTQGMLPFLRLGYYVSSILRVPVHVLVNVETPDRRKVLDNDAPYGDADLTGIRPNASATIVEWRIILVVALGCYPVEEKQMTSGCGGKHSPS